MPDTTRQAMADLIMRALDQDNDHSDLVTRARVLGDEATDLRDLVRWGAGILPGHTLDALRAGYSSNPDAEQRQAARATMAEVRAALMVPADVPGVMARPLDLLPDAGTGLAEALPLIRTIATPWDDSGTVPLIPAPITGNTDGFIHSPGDTLPAAAPFTINETSPTRFTMAAAVGDIARQVWDWTGPDSLGLLDKVFNDMADRAAEKHIGNELITAGTAVTAGADLAATLDAAESAAAAAMEAPADLVLVNPADLPAVRRAVAPSWQIDPHPALLGTIGTPAGTAIVTGRNAFVLLARPITTAAEQLTKDEPRLWSRQIATFRDFLLVIRQPAGAQIVTL